MPDLLITATEYHARVLNEAAIQTRQIYSFRQFCDDWLKLEAIQVLSVAEEHLIWQETVKNLDFPDVEALILSFEEADRLMRLYQIDAEALANFDTEMLQLFRAKRMAFEAYLDQVGKTSFLRALKALALAKIPDALQGATIELFGFVEFPPLYQTLFGQLQQQGVTVICPSESQNHEPVAAITYTARNPEEEFLVALRSIEQEWQKQPQQTFAIVVQQSVLPWSKIHRLLKVVYSPLQISCPKGEALVDQPQFLFLEEVFKSLYHADLQLFSRVLVSPFWPDDFARRIKLDLWMREHLLRVSTLPQMLRALLHYDPDIQNTLWFQTWSKLTNFEPHARDEFIRTYLSAAQFKDMPYIAPKHPNLHIVGALEAAMLPVDVVWLLSADQEHYPVKKTTILPKSILLQYGVPVESAALHQYGEKLVHAICGQRSVYVSFVPVRRGEKNALSRLFRSADMLPCPDIQKGMPKQNENKDLKALPIKAGADTLLKIPLSRQPNHLLKSGTTLLKEQAECPFKAFAHFRLKVTGLKSGQEILDPLQKGSLIHHVLDKLWTKLQTQQQLKALTEQEQHQLVYKIIDESLQESGPSSRRKLIRKLERNRLARIIEAWLELEKQRLPFRVKATEVNTLVHLGGMQFKIRLDRVDQVGESEVIIDYKTGEVSAKNWFEERLRDLQLPLYAVTHAAAAGAIFARLKVGKMGFTGIVENEALSFDAVEILKEGKTWEMQRQHWQMQLEALMQEFQEGRLDVAPIDDKACLYCDLAGFCRVKEINNAI